MPELDDGDLLGRIASSDHAAARGALDELYRRHAPMVLQFLTRALPGHSGYGTSRQDAEDLLHDTFLAAARRADLFSGADARGWLLTLARNRARDRQRNEARRSRRERAVAGEAGTRRSHPVAQEHLGSALEQALARLQPGLRAALELRFMEGLPHLEVANALGVSLRTAKQRSANALERLRELMEND